MKGSVKSKAVELQGQTLKIDQRKTGSRSSTLIKQFYKVGRLIKVKVLYEHIRQVSRHYLRQIFFSPHVKSMQ